MRTRTIVKKILFALVVVSILATLPYKSVMAGTELNADDFEAKINSESETWNFFIELALAGEIEGVRGFAYDETYDLSKEGVITTSRGINIGSELSAVTDKYGKGIKYTISEDIVYNSMPIESLSYFSNAEYVLTYAYNEKAENGGEFTSSIHFYIDKNDEVALIFYSRVLKNTEATYEDTEVPKTGEKNSLTGIYLIIVATAFMGSYKINRLSYKNYK